LAPAKNQPAQATVVLPSLTNQEQDSNEYA